MSWKKEKASYIEMKIHRAVNVDNGKHWPRDANCDMPDADQCRYFGVRKKPGAVVVSVGKPSIVRYQTATYHPFSKGNAVMQQNDDVSTPVANFQPLIVGLYENIYMDQPSEYWISIEIDIDGERKPFSIMRKNYINLAKEIKREYPNCCIYKDTEFCKMAADLYGEACKRIVLRKIYYFGGWHNVDHRLVFLHAGKKNVFSDILLSVKREEVAHFLPNYWQISSEKDKLNILLLYALWASVAKFYELSNIDGLRSVLYISAPTGTGKTTVAKVLVKALLKPDGKVGLRFDDTNASLEESLISNKDRPVLVDDFYAKGSKYEDAVARSKVSNITRIVGDGAVKGKMGPDRKPLPDRKYRGAVIATGEYIDLNTQSSYLRCWVMNFPAKSIFFNESLGVLQKTSIAKSFLSAWIAYLEKEQVCICENLSHWHDEAICQVRKRYPKEYPRFQSNVAAFLVLARLFCNFCQIWELPIDSGSIISSIWKEADEQLILLREVSPEQLFKNAVEEALDNAYLRIASNEDLFKTSEYDGFLRDDIIWIITARLDKVIESYAERKSYGVKFNENLKNSLMERGILYKGEPGYNVKYSKNRSVEPKRPRLYKINKEMFYCERN